MFKIHLFSSLVLLFVGITSVSRGDLIFSASLINGNYGGGQAINTFPLPGSPPAIVNSSTGVHFASSEGNGRSNGLINYQLGPINHSSFRSVGTVSIDLLGDRDLFMGGDVLTDNFGFNQFNNGQSAFSLNASRQINGPGNADDKLVIGWSSWHSGTWYNHGQMVLDFGTWYDVGFTWRGPDNRFEMWANQNLLVADNVSPNTAWGDSTLGLGSGYNFGIGDNHQRGIDGYNSAAYLMYRNLGVWNNHVANGGTVAVPEPSHLMFGFASIVVGMCRRSRKQRSSFRAVFSDDGRPN